MEGANLRILTRTGIIVALTLILQSLRLWIPMPPQFSFAFIGVLVNACLITAVLAVDLRAGIVTACVTPFFAYIEGMLPFLPFVVPVALGNCVYVLLAWLGRKHSLLGFSVAALGKAATLFLGFYVLFAAVAFPPAMRHTLLFIMSWPQVVTGLGGAAVGFFVCRSLARSHII